MSSHDSHDSDDSDDLDNFERLFGNTKQEIINSIKRIQQKKRDGIALTGDEELLLFVKDLDDKGVTTEELGDAMTISKGVLKQFVKE